MCSKCDKRVRRLSIDVLRLDFMHRSRYRSMPGLRKTRLNFDTKLDSMHWIRWLEIAGLASRHCVVSGRLLSMSVGVPRGNNALKLEPEAQAEYLQQKIG